jgi:FkbM family methyltransferase
VHPQFDTNQVDAQVNRLFEHKFGIYRSSKLARLQHGHMKLIFSKFLEYFTRKTGSSVRQQSTLVWGEPITIVYPDSASIEIARYGCYEEGLTKMVLNHVGPGVSFFDIGAHIGYYTMLASWLVGETGQVHAFEPTPSTFELLRANTQGKDNVKLNQVALSSASGNMTFNDYGTEYMGSNSKYVARLDKESLSRLTPSKISVTSLTLDDYVERLGVTPDFVKIDAESSEFEILQGMSDVLERNRPIVSVEVGDMDIECVPSSAELIDYLTTKGYKPYEFVAGVFAAHKIKPRYTYDNIFFLPES